MKNSFSKPNVSFKWVRNTLVGLIVIGAIFASLLADSPTIADEEEVTVPINQVVKMDKLSAEQLAKAKVTVPISWVNKEYLEKHGYAEEDSTQEKQKGVPDNIPDGTYTQEPEITSKQSNAIKISNFKFKLSYDKGSLVEVDVIFSLKNDSGTIKNVTLTLEDEKQLQPTDGKFDEATEEFSQTVKSLKEGNLYRGTLQVEGDSNSDTIDFKIYPREFVNIADDDDMKIVAHYYPWVYHKNDEDLVYQLLMGDYDPTNQEDINKHIDWATGHGIDAFIITWNGIDNHTTDHINDYILEADLMDDMKFMLLLGGGSWSVPIPQVNLDEGTGRRKELRENIRYFNNNYFNLPNYMEIEGDKPIFLYGSKIFKGDVEGGLTDARNLSKKMGNELYLIGDDMGIRTWRKDLFTSFKLDRLDNFDALSAYTLINSTIEMDYKRFTELSSKTFEKFKKETQADIIPFVQPGYNDRKIRPERENPILKRDPEVFREFCRSAKESVDNDINVIFVNSWNEWNESSQVEPAKEYGFKYLEIIKNTLAGDG